MLPPPSFRIAAALVAALLALLLAGCSSPSQSTGVAGPQKAEEPVGGGAPSPSSIAPGSASPGVAASPTTAGSYTVNVTADLRFDPSALTVPRGATVTWHNASQHPQTATGDPAKAQDKAHVVLPPGAEPWDSGEIAPGQSFSHRFDTPGTYQYVSLPHESAGMVASVVVTP